MKRIAIFASGNGSNAENMINYLRDSGLGWTVALVLSDRPEAKVIQRAVRLDVPYAVVSKTELGDSDIMIGLMERYSVDAIVLAGFLRMIPGFLIERYPGRIVNIHPSLLPKYGGKGMYGRHVHEAVVAAKESETGITIHLVDEHCDGGRIIFQARTAVAPDDTAAEVEEKIHELERLHFPLCYSRFLVRPLIL